MTESLTTGEMLDTIKVGDWAVSDGMGGYIKVTKNSNGEIVHDCGGNLSIGAGVVDKLWTILPKYISFYEAMAAVNEGKTVVYHRDNGSKAYFNRFGKGHVGRTSFGELANGNWSIFGNE